MDSATSPNSSARSPSSPINRPRVLITAGPTHEPIDRVRYIGNRSSGRMGIALAEASIARDWPVTLLLGPNTIPPPHSSQLAVHRFQTAADLQHLLHQHWPSHDLLLMAAAVADFRVNDIHTSRTHPSRTPPSSNEAASDERAATPNSTTIAPSSEEDGGRLAKIKRTGDRLTLELIATPDLLAGLATITQPHQTVIGFALEPAATLAAEAARKLKAKRLDAIVANPLETMDSPDISATLLLRDGRTIPAPANMPKPRFAEWLLDQVAAMRE